MQRFLNVDNFTLQTDVKWQQPHDDMQKRKESKMRMTNVETIDRRAC